MRKARTSRTTVLTEEVVTQVQPLEGGPGSLKGVWHLTSL